MIQPEDWLISRAEEMNTFFVVGRVVSEPELKRSGMGAAVCSVDLEVERPFKNSEGVIESDIIRVDVWRGAAETLTSAARINSWIAARGRIQTRTYEKEGRTWTSYGFIAERIEYLR